MQSTGDETHRPRTPISTSPTSRKRNIADSNFEYQSDDSECSSQKSEECGRCSGNILERHSQGHKKMRRLSSKEHKMCEVHHNEKIVLSDTRVFTSTNFVLLTLVIALTSFYITIVWRSVPVDSDSKDKIREQLLTYETRLTELLGTFRNFSNDELYILSYLGKQWFMMLQKSPVVLIVAGSKSEDMVNALSEAFRVAFGISQPVHVFHLTSESSRVELHERLNRAVHSNVPLAILNGIDHLGWDAPLVLHTFADDSSVATHRTLLLLSVRKTFHGPKKECEQSIMEYLSSRWITAGGSVDNVSPILSRIMQFVICL